MIIKYTPSTLDDWIVKDGMRAVTTLGIGSYFIVGGMATQSYLPSSCRRPTSDIDLAIMRPLSREDFRAYTHSIFEFLRDNGYEVSDKKVRRAFCIDFSKNKNAAFISIPRHNERSFGNIESILRREIAYSREKIIEGTTDTCAVASPEDIIVRKISRAVNRLFRNPLFEQYVGSMEGLTRDSIVDKIKYLNSLREKVFSNEHLGVKLPEESEELLRLLSDLFDIRILSEQGGLNRSYFNEAVRSWKTLHNGTGVPEDNEWQVRLISRAVLPEGYLR